MITLFENRTIITKEVLTEFSQKAYKISNKKYRIEGLSLNFVLLLLASIIFAFIFFKGYLLKLNQGYKNLQKLHGELAEFTSIFYEDKMEVITSVSNLTINYNKITKISETKNLYLLMIGKNCTIIIKTGFTIGDADSFKSFIKAKCINE